MDGQWPDVLGRIAETGVVDELNADGADVKGKGKERGANHVSARAAVLQSLSVLLLSETLMILRRFTVTHSASSTSTSLSFAHLRALPNALFSSNMLFHRYLPSQGILPHTDGPAYHPLTATLSLSSHTILSLRSPPNWLSSASPSTTSASQKQADAKAVEKVDIFLPPRSLVLLSGTLYSDWLHGIQPLEVSPAESLKGCANWEQYWARRLAACEGDEQRDEVESERQEVEEKGWKRGKRISLTCRRVRGKVRKGLAVGLLGGARK